MVATAYQSDAAWNDCFWKKPEFDRLLLEARGMLEFDKRKELYWEMQQLVWKDNGNIIPMFGDFIDARREEVQGFEPNPANSLSGLRVLEKVGLASWQLPARFGLDPARIALAGDSAGAHLALGATLGLRARGGARPPALLLDYGSYGRRLTPALRRTRGRPQRGGACVR